MRTSAVLLVAAALSCLDAGGVAGSGVAKTEARTVGPFTAVDAAGQGDVQVTVGPAASVSVTGDDNIVPLVETVVRGTTLRVGWNDGKGGRPKVPLVVKITAPALDAAEVSGAASLRVDGVASKAFAAGVSGAGKLVVAGRTDALDAHVSGSGDVDAEKLAAKAVKARVSGAGRVLVAPIDALDAEVSGVGAVEYVGAPGQLAQKVSGVGTVKKR